MTGRARGWLATCGVLALSWFAAPAEAGLGDVNADGRVDLADSQELCRNLSGEGGPLADPDAADVTRDGMVDGQDVSRLMRAALGDRLPVRAITVTPSQLDFGAVRVQTSADLEVVVTSTGADPVTVSGVSLSPSTDAAFSIPVPPMTPVTLGPGEMLTVTVRVAPAGVGVETGSLEITSDADSRSVSLVAVGVSPNLSVSPVMLDFGDVPVGTPAQLVIILENEGSAPLTIASVAPGPMTSPDFMVGAPAVNMLAPGELTEVTVTYTPAETGDDTGAIDLLTDGGNASVTLAGRGVAPELDLSPDTLDFGTVLVGDTPRLVFEVRNPGSAPLEVDEIFLQVGSDDFALGTFPITPFQVLPTESQSIPVTFAPPGVGPVTGTVEVRTNAGDGLVGLSGDGVAPDIQLAPGSVGFDNILVGDTAMMTVDIVNGGTASLDIISVSFGAGTSTDFSFDPPPPVPTSIVPGTSVTVTLNYAPGEVGADLGTLEVASNDLDTPVAVAPLSGNGVATEFVLQPSMLNFSNVRVGQSSDLQFEILNSGSTDFDLLSVEPATGTGPGFSLPAAPSLPQTLTPGTGLMVTVRFAPMGPGPDQGTIDVGTSAGDGMVLVEGNGTAPAITATPSDLDFGTVPVGSLSDLTLTLLNGGSASLNVTGIAPGPGSDAAFTVLMPPTLPLDLAPGVEQQLAIRFAPTAAGAVSGTIRILSDDPMQPTLDVALDGNGQAGGFLTADPVSIGFGDVPVGSMVPLDIFVTNAGDASLTLDDVSPAPGTSAEFSIGTPSATMLAPTESATIRVTYLPGEAGPDSGAVDITASTNFVSVPLTGAGVLEVMPVALSLNVTAASLFEGDCLQLRGTVEFTDGSSSVLTSGIDWSSTDSDTVTVDATGLVVADGPGSATVTGTFGGLMAQAAIDVNAAGSIRLLLPCGETAGGSTVTTLLEIDTGALPLGAYAVRLVYDPSLVTVEAVRGGTVSQFATAPFSEASSYSSGATVLAAYQAQNLSSPTGAVIVAEVDFLVTGAPGAVGLITPEVVELVGTDLETVPSTATPSRLAVQP